MKRQFLLKLAGAVLGFAVGLNVSFRASAQTDLLPSWNDTPTKQAIVEFVGRVTKSGGPDFVAPAERIATFDNDGTLWVEQPMYVPTGLCARPRQGDGSIAPGMERQTTFQGGA
jgi:hypothetical protein